MTTTTTNKFKYVFPLKCNSDLTVAIRLIEVLGLKQGEYNFNSIKGTIEVNRDDKWEEYLTNKIKELGFENLLLGKSYSTSNETKFDSMSITYSVPEDINRLHNKVYETYKNSGYKICITSTEIDHIKNNARVTFSITVNNKINVVDYAVALSIYNRCCYPINKEGVSTMSIDDLINSIPDEEIVKSLNALKSIFF